LEVQDINQDFPNIKAQAQYFALADISTQIRLLQSEGLADRTSAKLRKAWAGVPIANNPVAPWWHVLHPPVTPSFDVLLKGAVEGMKVRAAGASRVIEVTVDSVDPRFATDFANTLGDEFIDQNIEVRWKMSEHTGDWLESQMQNTRRRLEDSEAKLQAYARSVGLLFTGGPDSKTNNVSEDKLRQVQGALSAATADRVAKQSRYEIAVASPPEGLPDVLNDGTLHDYRSKLTELQRESADLTALYTPDYPKVKRVQAQMQLVESNLGRQRAAILDKIKNEYEEAVKRENLLTAEYASQARTVTGENEKSIQYAILTRDVDSNRQLFDAMLQRIKEASVVAALRASNVRVLDRAKTPVSPYKPTLAANAGVALLAGLFLGVVVAVARERSDRSFRGPGQTTLWLNVPELGRIPDKKHNSAKSLYGAGNREGKEHRLREHEAKNAVGYISRERPELITLHRKSSMMAEAFRIVLPHVICSTQRNDRRTIVLTSANPAEGKTTVACNLAIALAESGQRVLLVDADLRRPHLHKVFGLEDAFGLSSVLQSGWTSIKSVSQIISENLYVLPSGPPIDDVCTVLFTERLRDLFATVKQEFDIVLIDAPPVLPIPDARVLGRMADGVILVVRAGQTTREVAHAALKSLIDVRCRVLGTILNYWDPHRFPFGSYEGYYRP
jgi:capsular exopolysaccharide synthesis family protein